MSSDESLKRIQAAFSAINHLPYYSGTVPLDPSMSTLFYAKNGKAEYGTPGRSFLPSFLPNGGYLGFGLSHRYPFKPYSDSLSQLDNRLKGSDAEIKRMCKALGLDVTLKAIYGTSRMQRGVVLLCCLVDHFINLGDEEIQESVLNYICRTEDNAVLVVPSGMGPSTLEDFGLEEGAYHSIVWIKPFSQTNNDFLTRYIAYGNEPRVGFAYGDVCLVPEVRLVK